MKNRILLVENSRTLTSILKSKLEQEGEFEVVVTRNLEKTRELFEQENQEFLVALVGYSLPDAPNGEVIDYVISRDVSSIVFTSKFNEQVREHLLTLPVVDYVLKNAPQQIDHIYSLITKLRNNAKTRVLIVDDSETLRQTIRSLLEVHRYQISEASNGEEALNKLDIYPDLRLVIVDYTMPGMDGLELISKIREKYGRDQLAVIGISATANHVLSAQFIKSGASDLISKPFMNEELCGRIIQNIDMVERMDELRHAKDKAQNATALKDKFVSLVAHDLRSPFSGMIGYLELMMEDKHLLTQEHQEIISKLLATSWSLSELIEHLLDMNRFKTGHIITNKKFFNATLILKEILNQHSLQADKKEITLNSNLPLSFRVYADPDLYSQVIQNLLSNAIKFCRTGGTISFDIENNESNTLIVRDNGIGIPKDKKEYLFSYDETTSTLGTKGEKGTGLGLPLCHDIMRAHGGSIRLDSTWGEGSTFYVSLPHKRPRVLLVDDSSIIRHCMGELLSSINVDYVEAHDGKQALRLMEDNTFHLIILDIEMPEINGLTLLEKMKINPALTNIPAIVLTADQKAETREKAFSLGAKDFSNKPIDANDLLPRIRRIIS